MSRPEKTSLLLLLLKVNGKQTWRRLASVGRQSRLLTLVIVLFIFTYLALSFGLFWAGLKFLSTFPGLGGLLVERLLYLLFAFLFGLLLLSNLIINYTNLFRNRESQFLLPLPLPPQTIFRWKFIESTVLASWAFVFLIAPLLAAYGLKQGVPWHFYPVTSLLVAIFIVLPGVAGAWAAVTLARFLDRRTFQVVAVVLAASAIVFAAIWLRPEPAAEDMPETRVLAVLDKLLARTRFAQYPLLPSYWLSTSVLQWAEGAKAASAFFMLVLLSNALFFGYLAFTGMGKAFYEGFSAVHSRSSVFGRWGAPRKSLPAIFSTEGGGVEHLFRWIPAKSDVKALLVKDARLFWRDTTQWGQTIVLFGLLGVYIINLRHFSQQLTNPFWVHLVSYLNLGACSLNLATLTTRFVYPQFSLEGKRLWIVGMAPIGLTKVLRTKFWLTTLASLAVTVGLIWLSCHMLKMPASHTFYFTLIIAIMAFTLNGLALGLGALYPNFKEENPSKIVSGFGGTFCLVLSFFYIVASVALLAVGSPWARTLNISVIAATWVGFLGLSFLLGRLPMLLGLRKVAQFEI